MSELRIFRQKLGLGHPFGEEIEDQRHPDPRPVDAGFAAADSGIDRDALEQGIHCFCLSVTKKRPPFYAAARRRPKRMRANSRF